MAVCMRGKSGTRCRLSAREMSVTFRALARRRLGSINPTSYWSNSRRLRAWVDAHPFRGNSTLTLITAMPWNSDYYPPSMSHLPDPVRQEFFGAARPASTLIGVQALAIPGMKVEIEAVVGLRA